MEFYVVKDIWLAPGTSVTAFEGSTNTENMKLIQYFLDLLLTNHKKCNNK